MNYTTEVPASRTASRIQERLRKAGAREVAVSYEKGRVVALSFSMDTAAGERAFTMPIESGRVLAVLREQRVGNRYQTSEHAERVALRVAEDWLKAMLAIIETGLVAFDEVMLPYMRTVDGSTVYQRYQAHDGLLLEGEQ